jgi:hypothetical protein
MAKFNEALTKLVSYNLSYVMLSQWEWDRAGVLAGP